MNKFSHRLIMMATILSLSAVLGVSFTKVGFPLFLTFVVVTVASIIAIAFLQRISMKCDQEGCAGIAVVEYREALVGSVFKNLLINGHRCKSCGNLIKPPRPKRS